MSAFSSFYVYQKFRMHSLMQHGNFPAGSTRVQTKEDKFTKRRPAEGSKGKHAQCVSQKKS